MRILRQSTATTLLLGPFLDATDGVTAMTSLTLSQSDIQLWKQGGTTLAQKNESTACTHRSLGLYTCPVDTTDTGTLGLLSVNVHESGALPIRQDYLVVPANVWDSLVSTDKLQVDTVEINSVSAAAVRLALSAGTCLIPGTVHTGDFSATTTEFEADDITEATADHYNGRVIIFTSGALLGQARRIDDYALSGSNGHFTVAALTDTPANDVTFLIV